MAVLHERDANRIASLEREILLLKGNPVELESNDDLTVVERLEGIESRLDDLDSGIEDANSTAENAYSECSDLECRIDELEQLHQDEIDPEDIERTVLRAVQDDINEQVISAVRSELDAVDFRVTIER
jgi:chromosome segregation ATPase